MVVRVKLIDYWQNCPRYIHKYKKLDDSKYIPKKDVATPVAGWKKLTPFKMFFHLKIKIKLKRKILFQLKSGWRK